MSLHMSDTALDLAIASIASKTTTAGATAGVIGFAVSINWIAVAGVAAAIGGLLVNLYFRMRQDRRQANHDRRDHEEHIARMAEIAAKMPKPIKDDAT